MMFTVRHDEQSASSEIEGVEAAEQCDASEGSI